MNRKSIAVMIMILTIMLVTPIITEAALGNQMLYFGSTGYDVRQLQVKLSHWGYHPGPIDGVYGSRTEKAIISFQKDQGLRIDGMAGIETINRLLGKTTATYNAKNLKRVNSGVQAVKQNNYIMSVTQEEINLLSKAIYSEARGESYKGQVAVGAVVLNRVKHSEFPNTIKSVIFEPWAFTAVHDGQFWLQPDQQAIRAAKDALKGWDPTGGATFYYNPSKVTSNWIYSRPVIKRIGKHYFAG